ncbi:hypothetical protein GQ42DRAFT_181583 [Ramicandelaber brevisporus]|nr:hypothetical protein GQ42DRAFT_181583 [Ramicandelaber brevisporus]
MTLHAVKRSLSLVQRAATTRAGAGSVISQRAAHQVHNATNWHVDPASLGPGHGLDIHGSEKHYEFPAEGYTSKGWTRMLLAIAAGFIWYRVDERLTEGWTQKHPITRYIEYHMTRAEDNDANLERAIAITRADDAHFKVLTGPTFGPRKITHHDYIERSNPWNAAPSLTVDMSEVKKVAGYRFENAGN